MKSNLVLLICLAVIAGQAECLYSASDDVIQLTASDFSSKVLSSSDLWLVEFYAPWCGHCKNLAPEWAKAAKALKGVVKVAAIDMDKEQSIGSTYGIKGFPTIKLFAANKNSPVDYAGGRTAQAIVDEALSQLKSMVKARLSGGSSSSGSSGKRDVIELTEANFASQVLNSDDIWLVEFFAPWCGHCKNLEPEWARAATDLKGKVKLGAVDATVHSGLAQRYGVQGYPTIKYFAAGAKSSAEEYDGGRTASDIVTWALNKVAESAPPPEIVQLTEQAQLEEACDKKQVCLIAFLPSLFDCQSECRKKYVGLMKKMGEKYKRQQWGWLWAEPAKYVELEAALSVGGFGYPAMVAVNSRKGKYVVLRGSFSESGINEFLRELSVGRGQTLSLANNKLPAVSKSDAWDGKDAKLVVEEDIDLSDVSLDDLDDGVMFRRKSVHNEDL
ncbi:disulfide-isomerase A6 [Brachionus plicatilis]|uniref:protein disulfide-isomerase n=1 Tax=Brachionus plicatilis TaxID=10195 RepID=A0A3M7S2Q2_BRAPC|nr:disulfide-isomerase A6 [Brachionus plicatilis]